MENRAPKFLTRKRYKENWVRTRSDGTEIHIRTFDAPLSIRQDEEDENLVTLVGYGLKWNTPAEFWGEYEQFAKGCFADTLRDHEQFQLVEHNYDTIPYARTGVNFTLTEDDTGLKTEAVLSRADAHQASLIYAVENGILTKQSIGFSWRNEYNVTNIFVDGEEYSLFTYTKVNRLYESSAVKWPVHESSEIAAMGENLESAAQRSKAQIESDQWYARLLIADLQNPL